MAEPLTVAVLVPDGVVAHDVTAAVEVLGAARRPDGSPGYRLLVCASSERVGAGHLDLAVPHRLDAAVGASTVVVPGLRDASARAPEPVLELLRAAHRRGARVVGLCGGSLLLADAGLLARRRATTHWRLAEQLAAREPRARVEPDAVFVDDADVLTSGGGTAVVDLCLHLVGLDHGAAAVAGAAQHASVPRVRQGTEASRAPLGPAGSDALAELLEWASGHLREADVGGLAARAHLSPRTLARRSHARTGLAPLQWLRRERVRRAQALLATSDLPVERVAHQVGFGSASALRTAFGQLVGAPPRSHRAPPGAPVVRAVTGAGAGAADLPAGAPLGATAPQRTGRRPCSTASTRAAWSVSVWSA